MNTRLKSKRRQAPDETQNIVEEEILDVVKVIDFSEYEYPANVKQVCNNTESGYHEIITNLETIPDPQTLKNGSVKGRSDLSNKELKTLHVTCLQNEVNSTSKGNIICDLQDQTFSKSSIRNETFVPGKEFFKGAETRKKLTSDYSSGSDSPSKLRESTRRLTIRKPFNSYIAYSSDEELEDWWEQPKTDYTYSSSLTYRDRVTPERRIGSPNMSRRRLRGGASYTMMSPPFSSVELPSSAGDSLALRSRQIPRRELGVFSDDSDVEESHIGRSSKTFQQSVTSNHSVKTTLSFASRKKMSGNIQYGLDGETDTEEESPGPRFANPIVRRGTSSLLESIAPSSTDSSKHHHNKKEWEGGQIGNHVSKTVTTTTTHSRASHAMNGGRYQFNKETKELQQFRNWRDILYSWSHYYWWKCRETSIIFSSVIILWLAKSLRAVRSLISRKRHRSHSLDIRHSENDIRKTSKITRTTVTTTTVMSTKRKLYVFTEKVLDWYKVKRKLNPYLWTWLPLLLLLLLLFPLLALLTRTPDPEGSLASKSVPVTTSRLYSSLANSTSWMYLQFATLLNAIVKTTLYLFEMCLELFVFCFETIWLIALAIFQTARSIFLSGLGYVSSAVSNIRGFFADSSESISSGSQYLTSNYAPLTMISSSYSFVVDNLKTFGNYCLFVATQGSAYIFSGLVGLLDIVLWVVYFAWFVISSLFSSLWLLLCSLFDGAVSGISESLRYSSNIFMYFPVIGTSSKERTAEHENVVQTLHAEHENVVQTLHTSQDVVIEKILQSAQLQDLLARSFQKNMEQNDMSKEMLLATARLHIEAEVEKLRLEISDSSKSSSENQKLAREEIVQIKSQQYELLSQIKDIEATLKTMFANQKTIQDDLESRDNLEIAMSGFSDNVKKLEEQFNALKKDHDSLASEVRSCCRNASLTTEHIERHVSLILADLLGLHSNDVATDEGVLSSKFGIWLKSYFVAKDELEGRINNVLESVQMGNSPNNNYQEEAVKQTVDLAMDSVLEEVRAEMKAHKVQTDLQIQESNSKASEAVVNLEKKYSEMDKQNVENYISEEKLKLQGIVLQSQAHMTESIHDAVQENMKKNLPVVLEDKVQAKVEAMLKDKLPAIMETYSKEHEMKLAEHILHLDQKVTQDIKEQINVKAQLIKSQGAPAVQLKMEDRKLFSGLNESEVQRIVKKALLKYDADKTGMVDHALESGGGSIVSTRCTEGFQGHQAELTVFGYSVFRYSTNTPRSIIQPDRNPGQCYAFKGTQGYIVVQFAGPVRVTAFTVEHIPKALTPTGTIDSAPKEFSVYGLQNTEEEGFHFGNFIYKEDGEPLQFFPVSNHSDEFFKYVELKILSNHGNMNYTCIYRFRVHGVRKF